MNTKGLFVYAVNSKDVLKAINREEFLYAIKYFNEIIDVKREIRDSRMFVSVSFGNGSARGTEQIFKVNTNTFFRLPYSDNNVYVTFYGVNRFYDAAISFFKRDTHETILTVRFSHPLSHIFQPRNFYKLSDLI